MAEYDAAVLQQYADTLYRKAEWITTKCALAGAVIGGVLALVLIVAGVIRLPIEQGQTAGIGATVAAIIGVLIGQRRSFQYRLLAQTVLCQKQIEYNTRRTS